MLSRKKAIVIILMLFLVFLSAGVETRPAEETTIVIGTAIDIQRNVSQIIYEVHNSMYVFNEDNTTSQMVVTGSGPTLAQTRQEGHTKLNRKYVPGQEKVFLISDEFAQLGIAPLLNLLYKNPATNNTAYAVVCKGKSLPYLQHEIPGYSSPMNFIEGLIKNSKNYNFFSDNFDMMDLYVRSAGEGRTTLLPYLELSEREENPNEKELKIAGTALLKKDKMIANFDMEDTRIINLLRENKVKGILKIQQEPKKFIEYYGKSKRKVKCVKEGNKYNFTINLDLKGDIVSNELYKNIMTDVDQRKNFEKRLAEKVEETCNNFLNKMKKEYKVDCLELGKVAAATYGRRTGIDWDEVVSKSNIKVNVRIKIDKQGRGDY